MKSNQTIDQFEIKKSNLKEVDLMVCRCGRGTLPGNR